MTLQTLGGGIWEDICADEFWILFPLWGHITLTGVFSQTPKSHDFCGTVYMDHSMVVR